MEHRTAPAFFGPIDNTVPVGTQPQSIAIADFNGDDKPDLAVANVNGNELSILLGNGSGGFSPAPGSPIAINRPYFVAAADFNGDGKQDLAVANNQGAAGTVTVLLGDGSGGFSQSVVAHGDSLVSVAVGDLNGDGNIDIAATNNVTSGGVTALLGDGHGGFTPAAGSPFAAGDSPRSVVIGDLNGDGYQDLAATNIGSNDLTVILGNGSGGFNPAPASPLSVGTNPSFLAAGDFNGDGIQDLAIPDSGSNVVTILLGSASNPLTPASGSPVPVGSHPGAVAVGDFNGDGKQDLAVTDAGSNDVAVLLGGGDGTFTPAAGSPVAAGNTPYFVAAGDLNGDGQPDLAVANYIDDNLAIFLNHGRPDTTTSLVTSGSPTTVGQVLSFTATVTTNPPSAETPTGIVSFFDGGTLLGTGALSGGVAAFSTAALRAGSHNITALFNANSNFAGGPASNTVSQQVNPADTTVTLSGPGNATIYGQVASFTAVVSVAAPGGGIPTGTVTFFDGANPIGMAATLDGVAVLNTTTLAPGSHDVTAVYNGSADYVTSPASNTVTQQVNGPPTLGGVPSFVQMDELTPLTFTATDTNAGPSPVFSLVGGPEGATIDPATGAFSWTPTEAQGPGTFEFTVRLTDGSTVDDAPITVIVNEVNTVPTLSNVPANLTTVPGTAVAFTATATDPDLIDGRPNTLTYSLVNAPTGASIDLDTGEFTWTPGDANPPGDYTFKVRVADDGIPSLSDTKTITVSVKPAAVIDGDLLIGGTARNDAISVSPSKDLSQLVVMLNRAVVGVFPAASVTGEIVVHGLSGNDAISVSRKFTKPAWLFGDAGNDRLIGGGGNNLLVGGAGNDKLTAKTGTNVMIGGLGADNLTGGSGDDLLIAGPTIYDADPAGLSNIFTEWASGNSYDQRVTDLTNGVNGTALTAATVQNDFAKDTLHGKKGNDWFIVSPGDKTDDVAGETVTTIV